MNTKKMYQIEVDEEVYNFLKDNAEPFVDTTPNSVLKRFLPLKTDLTSKGNVPRDTLPDFPASIPNALAQVLQMIHLVKNKGMNRVEATHMVADIRGISNQAVIDKYCRQLGKRAYEIDELLMDSNIGQFKKLLIDRFPYHIKVIESIFSELKG